MGSLCLSSASILRCAPLSRIENIVLIIPTALEIISTSSLLVTHRGKGWQHCFLLTLDSWTFLILTLLDIISHVVPAVRDHLNPFAILDTFIGAASSVPILFYALFLLFSTRTELPRLIPPRFQTVVCIMLILFIPIFIGFNEVASLLGVSHIYRDGRIYVGFQEDHDRSLWTFFTSMTLALLAAYQIISFTFAFSRIVVAFNQQRDLEASSSSEKSHTHPFRGTLWVSAGIKLGAIETIVGFADAGFGVAITRRVLRMLCRACICMGLITGLDNGEDNVRPGGAGGDSKNGMNPRLLISNPRHSTFRQLSPSATEFHLGPRMHNNSEVKGGLGPRLPAGLVGLSGLKDAKQHRAAQRVTIHFAEGAPRLEMRFSQLDMPSPATIVNTQKLDFSQMEERLSEYYRFSGGRRGGRRSALGRYSTYGPSRPPSARMTDSGGGKITDLPPDYLTSTGKGAILVDRQSWTTSPEPASIRSQSRISELDKVDEEDNSTQFGQGPGYAEKREAELKPLHLVSRIAQPTHRSVPSTTTATMTPFTNNTFESHTTQQTTPGMIDPDGGAISTPEIRINGLRDDTDTASINSETKRRAARRKVPSQWLESTNSGIVERYRKPTRVSFITSPGTPVYFDKHATRESRRASRRASRGVSWVQNPYDDSVVTPAHVLEGQTDPLARVLAKPIQNKQLTRIKSMGRAPRRATPTPSLHGVVRGSIHIEPILIPPRGPKTTNVYAVQGSDTGSNHSSMISEYSYEVVDRRPIAKI